MTIGGLVLLLAVVSLVVVMIASIQGMYYNYKSSRDRKELREAVKKMEGFIAAHDCDYCKNCSCDDNH